MSNRNIVLNLSLVSILAGLSGCATQSPSPLHHDAQIEFQDHAAPAPEATIISQKVENAKPMGDRLIYYHGEKGTLPKLGEHHQTFNVQSLLLNFVNASAGQVAQAVIGEALGKTVAIAEGAQGTITLTSSEAVAPRAALEALETVLAQSNLALVENPSGFTLTNLSAARNGTQTINGGHSGIGYGSSLTKIEHTSASNVVRLAQPFLGENVTLVADDIEGVIIIQGPATDTAQAEEIIALFDTPALTGNISGLFNIRYADVADLRTEIESVMANDIERGVASVKLIDLPRLNQLLVITRTKKTFADVKEWIERLDIASGGDERRLRYYIVQNAPASTIGQQLNTAFGGQSGQSQLPQKDSHAARTQRPAIPPSTKNNDNLSIVADELNNALIIRSTDSEYREIASLIERMDVLPQQVLIEAMIAEVTLTDDLKFGVRWFWENKGTTANLNASSASSPTPIVPGFNAAYLDGLPAGLALNALASITDVSVLSAPSIMVQNNQTASLQVGDEVPIVTQENIGTDGSGAPIRNSVQLRETGVILEVKPRINASGIIVLEVTQEVSEAVQNRTGGIDSPTIQQRQFTSTVSVPNNGTVALGGLIRDSVTDNNSGIPYLKNTPGIGGLFRSKDIKNRRTELMIFLTPRIIENKDQSDQAIKYLKSRMNGLTNFLESQD